VIAYTVTGHAIDRRRTTRPQVIVVAEDADALRELWQIWLSHLGFEVVEACTGAEALTLATEHGPAAVIMDLSMPVMDGLEATRRLKQHPGTADVPVLIVTAHASPAHRRAAEEAGCAAFVRKPVDPYQLIAELRRVLAGV
jgi:CheY-like chemotaxis protein